MANTNSNNNEEIGENKENGSKWTEKQALKRLRNSYVDVEVVERELNVCTIYVPVAHIVFMVNSLVSIV